MKVLSEVLVEMPIEVLIKVLLMKVLLMEISLMKVFLI